MIKLLIATLTLISTTALAGPHAKVCLANEAGGLVVLTAEKCDATTVDHKLFPYSAYATESNGTIHHGCYNIPSTKDAKKQPNTRIIPLVNYQDSTDGEIITFQAEWFTTEACKLHTEI
jgi:hypothetical protein